MTRSIRVGLGANAGGSRKSHASTRRKVRTQGDEVPAGVGFNDDLLLHEPLSGSGSAPFAFLYECAEQAALRTPREFRGPRGRPAEPCVHRCPFALVPAIAQSRFRRLRESREARESSGLHLGLGVFVPSVQWPPRLGRWASLALHGARRADPRAIWTRHPSMLERPTTLRKPSSGRVGAPGPGLPLRCPAQVVSARLDFDPSPEGSLSAWLLPLDGEMLPG